MVIKAIAKMGDHSVHYLIAGQGVLQKQLEKLAFGLGVAGQIHFLGFREDIADIMKLVDIYCLPSLREGLNVSLMEAIASGLPCIVSNIRGNRDLIDCNGGYRVTLNSSDGWARAISDVIENKKVMKAFGVYNQKKVLKFSSDTVNRKMRGIYGSVL